MDWSATNYYLMYLLSKYGFTDATTVIHVKTVNIGRKSVKIAVQNILFAIFYGKLVFSFTSVILTMVT